MISLSRFEIIPKAKMIVADISELSLGNTVPVFRPVYSDACDLGFQLMNDNTGNTTMWVVSQEVRDEDGDLTAWKLVPMSKELVRFPEIKGWSITIYND